jgi:hypothetical protein
MLIKRNNKGLINVKLDDIHLFLFPHHAVDWSRKVLVLSSRNIVKNGELTIYIGLTRLLLMPKLVDIHL